MTLPMRSASARATVLGAALLVGVLRPAHHGVDRAGAPPVGDVVAVHATSVAREHPHTGWRPLNRAVRRLPGHRADRVRWVVTNRYGHWGVADWYHDTVYVSPSVPRPYLYSVAAHEWAHVRSVEAYHGDVAAALAAMDKHFHATGMTGAELAADCMARVEGATWTNYTSCHRHHWRHLARRLIKGRRL